MSKNLQPTTKTSETNSISQREKNVMQQKTKRHCPSLLHTSERKSRAADAAETTAAASSAFHRHIPEFNKIIEAFDAVTTDGTLHGNTGYPFDRHYYYAHH